MSIDIMRPWLWGDRPAAPEQIAHAMRVLGHIAATGQPYQVAIGTQVLTPGVNDEQVARRVLPKGRLQ